MTPRNVFISHPLDVARSQALALQQPSPSSAHIQRLKYDPLSEQRRQLPNQPQHAIQRWAAYRRTDRFCSTSRPTIDLSAAPCANGGRTSGTLACILWCSLLRGRCGSQSHLRLLSGLTHWFAVFSHPTFALIDATQRKLDAAYCLTTYRCVLDKLPSVALASAALLHCTPSFGLAWPWSAVAGQPSVSCTFCSSAFIVRNLHQFLKFQCVVCFNLQEHDSRTRVIAVHLKRVARALESLAKQFEFPIVDEYSAFHAPTSGSAGRVRPVGAGIQPSGLLKPSSFP